MFTVSRLGIDGRLAMTLVTSNIPVMGLLHDRGVRLVCTDGASMGSVHDGAPVHQYALARGVMFVEMLTALDQLPARGGFFCFLPLKIGGSTGGPGRAIALLPADEALPSPA